MKSITKTLICLGMFGAFALTSCDSGAADDAKSKIQEVSQEAKQEADKVSSEIDNAVKEVEEAAESFDKTLNDL